MIERKTTLTVRVLTAICKMALSVCAGLLCGHVMVCLIETIG